MRLRDVRRSGNVVDRRGQRGGGGRGGGPMKLGGLGLIIVIAIGIFTGVDVTPLLTGGGAPVQQSRPVTGAEAEAGDFAARVLTTTEAVWTDQFANELGTRYTPPQMVLFSGVTQSPCGTASGATGPFYCPEDRSAYLDTAFFEVMRQELGAGGDFAAAYVVAHEVAHHVQNQLGILQQSHSAMAGMEKADANAVSVRIELQADCLSGVWASQVEGLLEPGDLEEALNAAQRIGDDYLMRRAGQAPNPHNYTHGTSEQRARWFARGYDSAQIAACDTFSARQL